MNKQYNNYLDALKELNYILSRQGTQVCYRLSFKFSLLSASAI